MARSTRLRALLFADLVLVTLIFSLAFAHVLELPGKLTLDGPAWLTVQHHLYIAFGPFAAGVESAAIVLAWVLVVMLRGLRRVGRLVLVAAISTSIGLIAWFSVVSPMNTRLNGWTATTLPPDWTASRNQWEAGHAVHAVLFGVAFCALV